MRVIMHVFHAAQSYNLQGLVTCRAGAAKITGVEINEHMSAVAQEVMFRNGYGHSCCIINKDVRTVKVCPADQGSMSLSEQAHLCIFEVRDLTCL